MSESQAKPKRGRRLQTGVRTLIVLVATCGVTFWAARFLWESQHPAYGVARGLQARSLSERVNATRLLVQAGVGDNAIAIPPLTAALSDPEAEVRVAACEALTSLVAGAVRAGTAADAVLAANSALMRSLKDGKQEVRIAAARSLEYIVSSKGSARVIDLDQVFVVTSELLCDQDADVRIAALGALGGTARILTHGPPAALRANLADDSSLVRAAAVKALACFQRDLDMWIPGIFEVLEREENARVLSAYPNPLWEVRPPKYSAAAIPALVKGLSSRHRGVRVLVCGLLAALGPDARPAIPNLIKTMLSPIDTTMVGRMGHPASWDSAWAAAQALSKIAVGTPSAGEVIDALTEVVRTGYPLRRVAAADALSDFGRDAVGAVPALIEVVRENAATKSAFGDGASAARTLGWIAVGTPMADEAVSCLTEALRAESQYTREEALDALVRFGPKAAASIPRIRALTDDPYASVRSAAAKALIALVAAE
jgi:HEAT repeat protein